MSTDAFRAPVRELILVPSLLTLGVTLLRVVGELQNWSPTFFSRAAGGGNALVGISWLIPVFGFYFGWRLTRLGYRAPSAGKVVGFALLAIAVLSGVLVAAFKLKLPFTAVLGLFCVGAVAAVALLYPVWPAFSRVAICYALAARVPVALLMLVAILGHWGTHYDVAPPDAPQVEAMAPVVKWLWIGLLPQMTVWIYMTVVGGAVLGGIAALIAGRDK